MVSLQGSCNEYGSIHPQRVLLQTDDAQGDKSYFSLIKWSRCLQYKVQGFSFQNVKCWKFAGIFTESNRKSSPSELLWIIRFNLNQKKKWLNCETSIWINKKIQPIWTVNSMSISCGNVMCVFRFKFRTVTKEYYLRLCLLIWTDSEIMVFVNDDQLK